VLIAVFYLSLVVVVMAPFFSSIHLPLLFWA